MRQIHLYVRTSKRLHKEETQRRNSGNDGVSCQFQVVDQMEVILPHVFFVGLIRTPAEVTGEIFYGVKVTRDGERRVIGTLELFQHPVWEWCHTVCPFTAASMVG